MKKRSQINQGLPPRWSIRRGVYYYQVPKGLEHLWDGKQLFRLGDNLADAYGEYIKRAEVGNDVRTIGQLLERYASQVIPLKAPKTQTDNHYYLKQLNLAFARLPLTHIKPKHIYGYYTARSSKVAAKREIALLRHAYTKAIEWGLIDPPHPFKWETRLEVGKARTRLVTQEEVDACLSLKPTRKGNDATLMLQAYIELKLILGLRRGDMLRLGEANWTKKGLLVKINKTGNEIIYSKTDALEAAWAKAKSCRKGYVVPTLFCTRQGKSYLNEAKGTAYAFNSIWQRFMARVVKETGIERFHEHDLRAKVATDAKTLEHARGLMGHKNSNTTQSIYRRGAEKVEPLK